MTTQAKKTTNEITPTKMMATAVIRDTPLDLMASTAGLRPVAKKRAMIIRTNTWLTLPSARSKTIAHRPPRVAIKPK